jgi:hypothetical protein
MQPDGATYGIIKTIIKPIWTYGIELCGCDSKSYISKMQRSQSKILRMIKNAPWYVTNQTLHDDLKVPFIKKYFFAAYIGC